MYQSGCEGRLSSGISVSASSVGGRLMSMSDPDTGGNCRCIISMAIRMITGSRMCKWSVGHATKKFTGGKAIRFMMKGRNGERA